MSEVRNFTLLHDLQIEPLCAAGCISSSANDMAQYLRFQLNQGRVADVPLLPWPLLQVTDAIYFKEKFFFQETRRPDVSLGSVSGLTHPPFEQVV